MRWRLPNLLTLARIGVIPLILAASQDATPAGDVLAAGLAAAAGLTDWLDGYLARRLGQMSDLGRMLDPIADKLLVAAALLALALRDRLGPAGIVPAAAILLREILLSGVREHLAGRGLRLPVSRLAKWKTAAQLGAVTLLLAGATAPGVPLLWLAAALSVASALQYVRGFGEREAGSGSGP